MRHRPLVACLGTCKSGLRHIRRLASILAELRGYLPEAQIELITNAPPAGLPPGGMAVFSRIITCERRDMVRALSAGAYALAILDTLQLSDLAAFSGLAVIILRETPEDRLAEFRRDDGKPWDKLVVPNPESHWLPSVGPVFARSVASAGWVVRPTGVRRSEDSAGIVVATGGGGTPATRALLYPLLDAVIAGARARTRHPFRLRQALGPRARADTLAGADEVFDPGGDLNAVFRAADLVISTAGYNSVLKLASTDTAALLAAIPRSLDDQAARVRLRGPILGSGLEPQRIAVATEWLASQIDRPRRRPPVDLGPDGARRAPEAIMDMLCPVS